MSRKYVKVKSRKYLNTNDFPHGINPEMYKYCEKVLRVSDEHQDYYFLVGNEWIWDKDMVVKYCDINIIKNE